MRVVAGELGGRRLVPPPGRLTRPTSELVRGAIFNSLEARDAVADAIVADLFAGSGAMGIEALSRGAARVVFVESDQQAVRAINQNLDALALRTRATVRAEPVESWVRGTADRVDVVLADPPYGWDGWEDLLRELVMFPEVLVVAESDHEVVADGWEVVAGKRHGGTVVSHLRPRGARPT